MNYLFLILTSLIALTVLDCSGKTSSTTNDFPNVAVFEYLPIKTHSWVFKEGKAVSLDNTEISDSLEIIKKAIEENNSTAPKGRQVGDISGYKLQFLPIENAKGEKEVWINAMCRDVGKESESWKKDLIIVSDGGSCFFNIYVNLTNKTHQKLMVNGEA